MSLPSPAVPLSLPTPPPLLPRLVPPRRARATVGAGALLGPLAWLLFSGRPLGLSVPLFALALLAALALVGGREGRPALRRARLLLLPLGAFALMVALRDDVLLQALNLLGAGALLLLVAHRYGGEGLGAGVGGLVRAAARPALGVLVRPWALLGAAVDWTASRLWLGRHGAPLLRGGLLAAPVVGLFAFLLAMADEDFAAGLRWLHSGQAASASGEAVWAVACSAAGALLAAGWLGHALRRQQPVLSALPVRVPGPLGLLEGGVVLGSVSALFATFLGLQVRTFVRVLVRQWEADFTYAQYARRGFFELLLVALLTLALVHGLRHLVRRETAVQERLFGGLATLAVALVLGLLAVALRRLSLYEEVYGATRLRLFSHVFLYALAALLLWRGVTLWWGGEGAFARGVLTVGLLYVGALDVLSPDALIARHTLQRHLAGASADLPALAGLSADAVGPLVEAEAQLAAAGRDVTPVRAVLAAHAEQLRAQDAHVSMWHPGRWWAARALQHLAVQAR